MTIKQKTMNENKETEKIASIESEATITNDDIINKIARKTNLPEKEVREVIEAVFKEIGKL